ncbi:ABC transporter ATP-binding protein [Gordonia sp. MP11Mi]|uniref:Iron import ATP-binding/permease protein IrtA n=1 Tax=Gordonia sp. MP11Mi TaxID=3022769 RepID=A0AA97GUS6_9ACTN
MAETVEQGGGWNLTSVSDAPVPDRVALRAQARRDKIAAKELLAPVGSSISLASILVAVSAIASVVPFILVVEVCRELLRADTDTGTVTALVIAAFAVAVFRGLLQIIGLVWTHRIDASFQLTLRRRLAAKASRLPLGWFNERTSGDVKRLLSDDVEALHYLIAHVRLEYVSATVTPFAILVYLFVADWRLALVALLPLVGYAFALKAMMNPEFMRLLGVFTRSKRDVDSTAIEFVDGVAVIRAFGQTRKASAAFSAAVDRYADALESWKLPMTRLQAMADMLLAPVFSMFVITAAAVGMTALDWIDPLDLVPFLLVGVGLGASFLGFAYAGQALREGAAAARRITELEALPELAQAQSSSAGLDAAGAVRFDDVTFGYSSDTPVLHEIDLTLEPGTVTALVGPSGSGKTTLARLLARFHDVDGGAITIDGRDIAAMPLADLYSIVGFVFQDVHLIAGTVADNLRLARGDASPLDLENAARLAQIHDRIVELPHGYDSVVGTDVNFSGGEAQRLSIARTLLADSRVLVLDEATAFADPESEAAVQDALASVIADRTVLVIAHRLHTVTDVDQILVLDAGRVVERGVHGDLVAAGGLYSRLWQSNEDAMATLSDDQEVTR